MSDEDLKAQIEELIAACWRVRELGDVAELARLAMPTG